jgi:hypothetical protein
MISYREIEIIKKVDSGKLNYIKCFLLINEIKAILNLTQVGW